MPVKVPFRYGDGGGEKETKTLRGEWETGWRTKEKVGDGEMVECGLGQTENR